MKVYIIKQASKKGNDYRRVILKISDGLNEDIFYSGFLKDIDDKEWGKNGILTGFAELSKDKPYKK